MMAKPGQARLPRPPHRTDSNSTPQGSPGRRQPAGAFYSDTGGSGKAVWLPKALLVSSHEMSLEQRSESTATRSRVEKIAAGIKVFDIHTHLYDPAFGDLLLWGIDDLLVYHYLVAESFRYFDIPYEKFWSL